MTHSGRPSPSARIVLSTVQFEPWPPVLNPHLPLTTKPPSLRTAVPVGENTPLMRGSPPEKISSCASSGYVPASHDIALKIVATHDDDGQARATSASTSHCVWKSASSPPYFFGAVMRKTPARLRASNVSGSTRRACSVASGALAQLRHEGAVRSRRLEGIVAGAVIGSSSEWRRAARRR